MVILFAIHSSTVVLASVLMMLSGDSLPLNLTFISRMHITVSVMMVIAQILLIRGDLLIQGPRDETPRNSQQQETNTGAKQSPELNQQGSPARASNESKKKLKKVSERRSR